MTSNNINKSVFDVLNVHMRDQIMRIEKLVNPGPTSPNKHKRPFDDITNTAVVSLEPSVSPTTLTKPEDASVLDEMDHILKHTHILKQWYLGILQKKGKEDAQDDYLLCKVIKKGVNDAEDHAIKVLDHVQAYHLKRLELSCQSSSVSEKIGTLEAEQKKTTLKITDMIYAVKMAHMMKEVLNIYIQFHDIALKLYESNK